MSYWALAAAVAGGGAWTLLVLLVGVGIGKSPYTPPKDARRLGDQP